MNETQIFSIFIGDTFNLIWLSLALFLAGVLEAFLWKTSLFQLLNHPINTQLFGHNKKWRGLISLPLTCIISVGCLQLLEINLLPTVPNTIVYSDFNFIEYGLLVGFIFNLAELPNSFVKRRLNIPPGDESSKVFYWVDHMDSTYGVLLLWYLYFKFPGHIIATGILVTPLLFMVATLLRKQLGLK